MPIPKLFLYKAENANTVAILRRGNHRDEWELSKWDMNTDTFIAGQWLRHKIMNGKHASISPDGQYFAYHYDVYLDPRTPNQHFNSHGVVSRLPNFTALYFKDNFGGNWAKFGFDMNGGIIYSGMSGTDTLEKKGTEDIPLVNWQAVKAPSGYIKEERLCVDAKEPFVDSKGRVITTQDGKLLVNNIVMYDTTNHEFVAKLPV